VGVLYRGTGERRAGEARALLWARHPRLHLAIAGRGETAEALRIQATELDVAPQLHLLGLRADVSNVLAGADVFVLPSLSEGLPLALLEAMLSGCPVVASDVGEVRNVLADGEAGMLVPPSDARALAAAIDKLLTAPAGARELGDRARHRAAAQYGISRMVAQYAVVYEALLARRASLARRAPE